MTDQLTQTKGGRLFLYGGLEPKDELDEVTSHMYLLKISFFSRNLIVDALLLEFSPPCTHIVAPWEMPQRLE